MKSKAAILICMASALAAAESRVMYSEFLNEVQAGDVKRVTIAGQHATLSMKNGATAMTVLPSDYQHALSVLQDKRVEVEIQEARPDLMNFAPFLVLAGFWVVLLVWMKSR